MKKGEKLTKKYLIRIMKKKYTVSTGFEPMIS